MAYSGAAAALGGTSSTIPNAETIPRASLSTTEYLVPARPRSGRSLAPRTHAQTRACARVHTRMHASTHMRTRACSAGRSACTLRADVSLQSAPTRSGMPVCRPRVKRASSPPRPANASNRKPSTSCTRAVRTRTLTPEHTRMHARKHAECKHAQARAYRIHREDAHWFS